MVALKQRLGVMEDSKKEFLKKVTEKRNELFEVSWLAIVCFGCFY